MISTAHPRRVMVVDGAEGTRARLRALLAESPSIRIVGEADSVASARREVDRLRPDVVVIDMRLPDGNALDFLRGLRDPRRLQVVVLSDFPVREFESSCIAAGAQAFLDKSAEPSRLLTVVGGGPAIQTEATGEAEWGRWLRWLGQQTRRLREHLNVSQEQLARMAGVSQGAISRFETRAGSSTPLVIVVRLFHALGFALGRIDHRLVADEAGDVVAFAHWVSTKLDGYKPLDVTKDPMLPELVEIYASLPEARRSALLNVARAMTDSRVAVDAAPAHSAAS